MEISVRIYEEITGQSDLPPPVDEADYERRKHRRVPFGHRATITPERKGFDNTPTVVMVRDVSVGGVSFLNDEALKPGTPLVIEFKGHQDRPVQLHCAVARCETGGSGGTQFVIGASFDALLTKELPLQAPSETLKLVEAAPPEPKKPEPVPQAKPIPAAAKAAEVKPTPAPQPLVDETISAEDQARIAERLKKPAHEPAKPEAAPVAAVAPSAPAPVKTSALFKAADPAAAKKASEEYWSDDQPTLAMPEAAAPKAPPEMSEPVFRVVPLPDPEPETEPEQKPETISELEDEPEPEPGSELGTEPEPYTEIPHKETPPPEIQHNAPPQKEIPQPKIQPQEPAHKEIPQRATPVAAAPHPQIHDHHGKSHEVLARVKELLVKQEQSIEKQRKELKEQRERSENEIKSLRAELEDTKAKLEEVRSKSDEDESAIAELESFLKQHDHSDTPTRKNEAA